jgi:hypothetical protein
MDKNDSINERFSKGIMGLFLGLALMGSGIWSGRQLHIIWNIWPSTDGVVVKGGVREIVQVPYARGGVPAHRYTPNIEFRFAVNGKSYSTEAPSVYVADTFEKAAAKLARLYAPGTHHPIRYDPSDPRDIQFGTIEAGPLVFALLLLVAGVVLSALGLSSLLEGYRQHTESAPSLQREGAATVLPFPGGARSVPSEATLLCPGCGRRVKATEDNCPNCLRALRAA